MKIAFVTNDQETISQHFGRSRFFKIVDIEDARILGAEVFERTTGHYAKGMDRDQEHRHDHRKDHPHGTGPHAAKKHAAMIDEVRDCEIIISGGMGPGAIQAFQEAGKKVILTDRITISDAINDYLSGTLENLKEDRTC